MAKSSFTLQKCYMMRHMGGEGWLKTSEYRHMGEGSKIAQKSSCDILTSHTVVNLNNL